MVCSKFNRLKKFVHWTVEYVCLFFLVPFLLFIAIRLNFIGYENYWPKKEERDREREKEYKSTKHSVQNFEKRQTCNTNNSLISFQHFEEEEKKNTEHNSTII